MTLLFKWTVYKSVQGAVPKGQLIQDKHTESVVLKRL